MAYIIGIIVIGLFFLALHHFTDLTLEQKWWVTTSVLSVVAIAVMFNDYTDGRNQKMMDVAKKFNQNKTIVCNEKEIDNTLYSLSIGTYTFIGRENTDNAGDMISASDCQ